MERIRDKINRLFNERIEDKKQLDKAEELYNILLNNTDKVIKITNFNVFNYRNVLGYDFCISFIDTGKGSGLGQTSININNKVVNYDSIIFDTKNEVVIKLLKSNPTLSQFIEAVKPAMIHELVHVNDKSRFKKFGNSLVGNKNYFNHPNEFNAYYLQFSSYFYDEIRKLDKSGNERLQQFIGKFGKNKEEFLNKFWDYMKEVNRELYDNINEKYKIKWERRIKQLYDELKKEAGVQHV